MATLGPLGHWYVVAPASKLGAAPLTARLCGDTLTVSRDAQGMVSAGPDGPPIREHAHYIWAWRGAGTPPAGPPDLAPLARNGYAFEQRTITVRANWRLVLENSLDFAHSAFVHPLTQPTWLLHRLGGAPTMAATYAPTDRGLTVDGRLGRLRAYHHSFELPDRLRLVILPDTPLAVDLVVHHVPEDARTTRMEVLMGRRALPFERRDPVFKDGLLLIHRQDVAIVEAQQRARDAWPPPLEFHCAADAYTLLLRRVLDVASHGDWVAPDMAARTIAMRV